METHLIRCSNWEGNFPHTFWGSSTMIQFLLALRRSIFWSFKPNTEIFEEYSRRFHYKSLWRLSYIRKLLKTICAFLSLENGSESRYYRHPSFIAFFVQLNNSWSRILDPENASKHIPQARKSMKLSHSTARFNVIPQQIPSKSISGFSVIPKWKSWSVNFCL